MVPVSISHAYFFLGLCSSPSRLYLSLSHFFLTYAHCRINKLSYKDIWRIYFVTIYGVSNRIAAGLNVAVEVKNFVVTSKKSGFGGIHRWTSSKKHSCSCLTFRQGQWSLDTCAKICLLLKKKGCCRTLQWRWWEELSRKKLFSFALLLICIKLLVIVWHCFTQIKRRWFKWFLFSAHRFSCFTKKRLHKVFPKSDWHYLNEFSNVFYSTSTKSQLLYINIFISIVYCFSYGFRQN